MGSYGLQCFSLNGEVIRNIFHSAKPLGHHEKRDSFNLGFGFLYYGAVRAVRPKHALWLSVPGSVLVSSVSL